MLDKQDWEWLTSNTHVAHPFKEPNEISETVVDAYIAPLSDNQQDIRLHYLDDPTLAAPAVEFRFADGSVALTFGLTSSSSSVSAVEVNSYVFGAYRVLEYHIPEYGTARLMLLEENLAGITWPMSPTDAYLVEFTVQPPVKAVNTLSALGFTYGEGQTIELVAGFNTEINQIDNPALIPELSTDLRGTKYIRVNVDEGIGEGKFSECDPDTDRVIKTINGVGPDENGNINLVPIDCYRLNVPSTGDATESNNVYSELNDTVETFTTGIRDLLQVDFEITITHSGGTIVLTEAFYDRQDALAFGRQEAELLGLVEYTLTATQLEAVPTDDINTALASMSTTVDSATAPLGPPWYQVPHTLRLENDCSPCCDCDDYLFVYDEVMRTVLDRARTVTTLFYELRDRYQALIDKVEKEKLCREVPKVEVRLFTHAGWTGAVQVVIKNSGACAAGDFSVNIDVSGPGVTATRIRITTASGDTIDLGPKAGASFAIPYNAVVGGAKTVTAEADLYFEEGGGRADGVAVTATATGVINGFPVMALDSALIKGPFNKT